MLLNEIFKNKTKRDAQKSLKEEKNFTGIK
jgi:hypothetical protein